VNNIAKILPEVFIKCSLAKKIRLLRKRAGISQKDFAEQLGLQGGLWFIMKTESVFQGSELIDKIARFF
jgi:transcriptional regulator with XRE-family HTH domain